MVTRKRFLGAKRGTQRVHATQIAGHGFEVELSACGQIHGRTEKLFAIFASGGGGGFHLKRLAPALTIVRGEHGRVYLSERLLVEKLVHTRR